jgi:hypothetical protein
MWENVEKHGICGETSCIENSLQLRESLKQRKKPFGQLLRRQQSPVLQGKAIEDGNIDVSLLVPQ